MATTAVADDRMWRYTTVGVRIREEVLEHRQIGSNGPSVGIIGMGTMAMAGWYGERDDTAATAAINRAIDLGITLFDTADLYGGGDNERFVGGVLKPRRDKVIFATKWGHIWDEKGWPNGVNGRPERCFEACDDSLQRLGFDHIDLYYLHRVDPDVAIEDTIGAMSRLVEQGKVRWIGGSETKSETLRRAHETHPVTALQTEYSLWSREPEDELFNVCNELGIGFVGYAPLGRGLLSGKIKKVDDMPETDIRHNLPRYQEGNIERNKEMIEKLEQMAAEKDCSLPQLALAWIIRKQSNVVPIQGADRVPFVEDNAAAVDVDLSEEDMARIDAANPDGVAAGGRYPDAWMDEVNR